MLGQKYPLLLSQTPNSHLSHAPISSRCSLYLHLYTLLMHIHLSQNTVGKLFDESLKFYTVRKQ